MIVIIGGQYQGRHAFAEKWTTEGWPLVDDAHEQVIEHLLKQCGDGLWQLPEEELLRLTRRQVNILLKEWQQAVVILPECGSGVIPIDPRETVRRRIIGCAAVCLTAKAENCYRVFCGLGYRLCQDEKDSGREV